MSILAFLAIIATLLTAIIVVYLLVTRLTSSGREEALQRQVTKWSDDVKARLTDVEYAVGRLAEDWRKWKAGK